MTSALQTITLFSNDLNTLDTNVNNWIKENEGSAKLLDGVVLRIEVKDVNNYAFFNNNLLEPVFLATILYDLVGL